MTTPIIPTSYNVALRELRIKLLEKYPENSSFWYGFHNGTAHYLNYNNDLDAEYERIKESIKTKPAEHKTYFAGFAYGFWFNKEQYKLRINNEHNPPTRVNQA